MNKYGHYYICRFTYMLTSLTCYSNLPITNYGEYIYNAIHAVDRLRCTLKEFVDYELNPLI